MIAGTQRKLDPTQSSLTTKLLDRQFKNKVVGQEAAKQVLMDIYENYRAGFCDPTMPAGNALFLGPTGTGKTHLVETFAESLFGDKKACLRVDCAEFQHSHEIAKLLGSPPGYLGHRETSPFFTQETLNKYHTDTLKLSIVLFDEIEKASDALWSLLLGILDKATLTLGDNRKVDFSKAVIIMTSNLGAKEMAKENLGFTTPSEEHTVAQIQQKALSAVRSKFSPEFINRLQHIVTFHPLNEEHIKGILDIEIDLMNQRLASSVVQLSVAVSPKAKKIILEEGFDTHYGARYLKRTIDKRIQRPLAKLFNSSQVKAFDTVVVDYTEGPDFDFYVHPKGELSNG